MKNRITVIALTLLAMANLLCAADLTDEQKAFQTSVMQFIKEEGFSPTIDEDNSINFKKEGVLYWIDVSEGGPYYVEFHRSGLSCETANEDYVIRACNETNRTMKCVKTIKKKSSVSVVIELFCHSAEEFKYTFYRSMKALDSGYNTVKEEYNKLDEGTSSASDNSSGGLNLKDMLTSPMGLASGNLFTDSYNVLKGKLTARYKVDDSSSDNNYILYVWDHDNSAAALLTYHGMAFYNFRLSVSRNNSSSRDIKYEFKMPKTQVSTVQGMYGYMDKVVGDMNGMGINMSYTKMSEKYKKAEGTARVNGLKYELTLNEYTSYWEVTLWVYKFN